MIPSIPCLAPTACQSRDVHLLDEAGSIWESASCSVQTFSDIALGTQLNSSLVRVLYPGESCSVGEWIAVHDIGHHFRLSWFMSIQENGWSVSNWMNGGLPVTVPSTAIFKLNDYAMRAIVANQVACRRISLFVSKRDHFIRHIELGDPLPSDMLRLISREESIQVGDLIAVQPRYPEPWYVTRSVDVDREKQNVFYLNPHSKDVDKRFIKCFRKLTRYPVPMALPTVPRCEPCISSLREPLKTVEELVREWGHGREFIQYVDQQTSMPGMFGYRMQEKDIQAVEGILEAYCARFCSISDHTIFTESSVGTILERHWPQGTTLYVQADTHGDVPSLIALFVELQHQGKLDAHFKCASQFKCCFLGDYMDRGVNNLEALGLLLLFRMENPESVILIKGNHEDVSMNLKFMSGEEAAFLRTHQNALTNCYASLPVLLLVASGEGVSEGEIDHQWQYHHLAHASFVPSLNLSRVLKGRNDEVVLGREVRFETHIKPISKRTRGAVEGISARYAAVRQACDPRGLMWSDIIDEVDPHVSERGIGYVFSFRDMISYFRATSCVEYKICAATFGHAHRFVEYRHPDDHYIVATILPACRSIGLYGSQIEKAQIQGVMYTLAPLMKDWKKVPMISEIDEQSHRPHFRMCGVVKNMYESFDVLDVQ